MKKLFLTALTGLIVNIGIAQTTATNFNCNDCSSVAHDLFSELDSGKVIIICWVMPCGACTGPAKTTYNVAQTYATSHPNRVLFYLADDNANTSCTSLKSWADGEGITNVTRFSNAAIKMTDYGTAGMPKVVILGRTAHTVFYNANNGVNSTSIINAIDSALVSTSTTGISNQVNLFSSLNLFLNPANDFTNIAVNLEKSTKVNIEIYNQIGQKVSNLYNSIIPAGESMIEIPTSELNNGIYIVNVASADNNKMLKLVVSH